MGCFSNKLWNTIDVESGTETRDTKPTRTERTTDVAFLILFVLYLCGMCFIAYFSIDKGDSQRLINGIDSWGNVCGKKDNKEILGLENSGMDHSNRTFELYMDFSEQKAHLSFFNLITHQKTNAVLCVERCPSQTTNLDCKSFLKHNGYFLNESLIAKRLCHGENLPAHKTLFNRCMQEHPARMVVNYFSLETFLYGINSIALYYKDIKNILRISLSLSFISVILLQMAPVAAAVIFGILAALSSAGMTVLLWIAFASEMNKLRNQSGSSGNIPDGSGDIADVSNRALLVRTWDCWYLLFLSIVATVFLAMITFQLASVTLARKKVIKFFREVSSYFHNLPSLILVPILSFICVCAVMVYCIYVFAYIVTLQNPTISSTYGLLCFEERQDVPLTFLLVCHLLGCLWLIRFILGCQRVVLSGAVCRYFFSPYSVDSYSTKRCDCVSLKGMFCSFAYLIFYNLGSVAVGSLMIQPFQVFHLQFIRLFHKVRKKNNDSPGCRLQYLCCCIKCAGDYVLYISRYNYVCLAIYGDKFWKGGIRAVGLLSSVPHMFFAIHTSDTCLFLLKVTLMFLIAFTNILWYKLKYNLDLSSQNMAPVVITCIASYIMTSFLLNLFSITIDSMVLCYCDDKKRNNGSTKPFYSGPKLRKLMEKKRVRREGWVTQSLSIPMPEENDVRIYVPPERKVKRQRPRAAKGKRGAPGEIRTVSPREPFNLDTLSWDGSIQTVVDRFDMFVDQMMTERERSPLNKRRQKERDDSISRTPLPPINSPHPQRTNPAYSSSFPMALSLTDFSDDEKPKQESNKRNTSMKPQSSRAADHSFSLPGSTICENILESTTHSSVVHDRERRHNPADDDKDSPSRRDHFMNPAEPARSRELTYLHGYRDGMKRNLT